MKRPSSHRYPRTARLNEVILEVLAEELERLSDPRLGFVTLTGVDVTGDLGRAEVFYSSIDPHGRDADAESAAATAAALRAAASHLRYVVGRELRVKQVPRLEFSPDPAIAQGQRIETILREIHRAGPDPVQSGDAGAGEDQ